MHHQTAAAGVEGFSYNYYEDLTPQAAVGIIEDLRKGKKPKVGCCSAGGLLSWAAWGRLEERTPPPALEAPTPPPPARTGPLTCWPVRRRRSARSSA
jgi:hypothetical protein